jgi:spermidine/putrescine transport system ATP-binding protein
VIEQLGSPTELYENPATTFVANFLGQSNLIGGTVVGVEGDQVRVDMQGTVVSVPLDRAHTANTAHTKGWVGIRPEKVLIAPEGEQLNAPGNHMSGAVIVDSSFIGVSTQYVVRMPWGQEILAFEQNTGARGVLAPGTKVDVTWRPEFSFLLDASQSVDAGIEED